MNHASLNNDEINQHKATKLQSVYSTYSSDIYDYSFTVLQLEHIAKAPWRDCWVEPAPGIIDPSSNIPKTMPNALKMEQSCKIHHL